MIIVSQDRTFIFNNPTLIGWDDTQIRAVNTDGKDLVVLGVYKAETTPLVFKKIIDAFKKGEKVFEMPEVY